MTVIKLTSSGKGILVIDDEGKVYVTSVNSITYLLNGHAKGGFITTKRLPNNVAKDRFKPSELYDPDGIYKGDAVKSLTTTNDPFSVKDRKEKEVKKSYTDKKVW